ncbi:hypothetical protein [Devosia sp. Leaf64]|uniref:hypothetical protein n=1 Tax=Devosia sp. Leaf64 TaxID=1736229 RepID=UPI000714B6BD|nr:hypothetical protein [Devosia sp. Leaf64]KQN72392.1 hypothetical protein ASE94_07720 [Devosia sp. Leaf64]
MKDHAADKRSPIIGLALLLTAMFLTLFLVLLSVGRLPEGCAPGLWLVDRLVCLEPNALGDTFAGAFAPVAFVWLVAAVLLQRNELAAQRQELRESRAVSTQQVEEARRNVELISVQTKILEDQRKASIQKDADEDIVELARVAVKIFNELADGFVVHDGIPVVDNTKPWHDQKQPALQLYGIAHGDAIKCVSDINMQITNTRAELSKLVQEGANIKFANIDKLVPLSNVLAELDLAIAVASAPMRAEVGNAFIGGAAGAALGLYRTLFEHGTDMDAELIDAIMRP